jgi:uncharacterized protein YpmS
MAYKIEKTKNAQVLLITILVLTIIGIVVVGIVSLSNRDVQQVVNSEKYETLYNTAETELRKIIDDFGRYDIALDSTLTTKFNYCQPKQINVEYECSIQDESLGSTKFVTNLNIVNKKEILDFEVKKDRSLIINVAGYTSGLDISWDRAAAVEIGFIVRESAAPRNLKVIKDVYDLSGVYDSLVGNDPYNDTTNIHPFNYTALSTDPAQRQVSTRIILNAANVAGLLATDAPLYVTITPRIKEDIGSIKINVRPQTPAALPYQIREFTGTSFDGNDTSSPTAKVIAKIPLTPQIDSIFDYAILTNGVLSPY